MAVEQSSALGIYLILTGPNYISNWIFAIIIKPHLVVMGYTRKNTTCLSHIDLDMRWFFS